MATGNNVYRCFGKRVIDICLVIIAITLNIPQICIVAACIACSRTGPIIFSQTRMGKNHTRFNLYKFRTMVVDAHELGPLVTKTSDCRITTTGRFLRRTRLDELPQLFNVLKGDMSIVGPRPEVEKYVLMFKEKYEKILSIKPGITDPAILEYRNEQETLNKYENPEEGYIKEVLPAKIALYEKYLQEMSFKTDLKIVLKTMRMLMP